MTCGMRRIALTVAYDGTGYAGFQWQANAPTIQGELETAIGKLTGERVRLRAASRTDAGAHANGQVVDFTTARPYGCAVFRRALNHYLPPAIRVLAAADAPPEFHSRRSAARRCYRYHILNRRQPAPLLRYSCCHIAEPLDLAAMRRAAVSILGIRDFRQIVPQHPAERSAVRVVYQWNVERDAGNADIIVIECSANGFLRHQIRRINAILVAIGRGNRPVHALADALAGGSFQSGQSTNQFSQPDQSTYQSSQFSQSSQPGQSASQHGQTRQIAALPAHGLCLESVYYPEYDHLLKGN